METTSDQNADIKTNPANELPNESDAIKPYKAEKIVWNEKWSTGTNYIVRWYGYGPQKDTVKSASVVAHQFWDVYRRRIPRNHRRNSESKIKRGPSVERHASGRNVTKMDSSKVPASKFLRHAPRPRRQSKYSALAKRPPLWIQNVQ